PSAVFAMTTPPRRRASVPPLYATPAPLRNPITPAPIRPIGAPPHSLSEIGFARGNRPSAGSGGPSGTKAIETGIGFARGRRPPPRSGGALRPDPQDGVGIVPRPAARDVRKRPSFGGRRGPHLESVRVVTEPGHDDPSSSSYDTGR